MEDIYDYVVTLKNYEDLDNFYIDMEQISDLSHIPSRQVTCSSRRSISRNTHYHLTQIEAEQLKQDPRVLDVERVDKIRASITPLWTQSGNFDKSGFFDNYTHLNWGLLRSTLGGPITNWGSPGGNAVSTSTVNFSASGKNVDVIIVDGHIDPAHPEYAVNSNGTGGSRVIQLDWSTLTPIATDLDDDSAPGVGGTYVYTPYYNPSDPLITDDNNHGAHVAGTACGNRYGWARGANIYNINPYATNPNNINSLFMWDYIRAFHLTKPINPLTKRKNPTVCNCSYGYTLDFPENYPGFSTGPIVYINYRGTEIGSPSSTTPLTAEQITSGGIYVRLSGKAVAPVYISSIAADIQDAIADGIHVVGGAGNDYSKADVSTGQDYNNYFYDYVAPTHTTNYQHRGTVPSAAPGVTCVGAIDSTVTEQKANFSNCGPRVDLFAPGKNINSSVHSDGVADTRNASYMVTKKSGTSMASPQVTGVIACLLELYPTITPAEMRSAIISLATTGQISDVEPSDQTNLFSLQGANNKYLFAKNHRNNKGQLWPRKNKLRPNEGLLYPRSNRRF